MDTVVIFSGGPDSTAAALWAIEKGMDIELLTFQYRGAEQYGEIKAAMDVAATLKRPHTIIDFKSTMSSFNPLAHIMMHAGTSVGDSTTKTSHLMPFGAGMILGISANYALYKGINKLVWGATKDDGWTGKVQYTAAFANEFAALIAKSCGKNFSIDTPFSTLHKHEVLQTFSMQEDLFSITWSCKEGGHVQTGTCHSCVARRVAAEFAGLIDKTNYSNSKFQWPTDLPRHGEKRDVNPDVFARIFDSEKPETI